MPASSLMDHKPSSSAKRALDLLQLTFKLFLSEQKKRKNKIGLEMSVKIKVWVRSWVTFWAQSWVTFWAQSWVTFFVLNRVLFLSSFQETYSY